jgi:hypothetical protein
MFTSIFSSMESTQADPFNIFRSPFPSTHLTAAQDLLIQEQIRFPEREYVIYVISGSRTEIEYEDVSIDTTDFIRGSLTSSLVFSAKIRGTADNQSSHGSFFITKTMTIMRQISFDGYSAVTDTRLDWTLNLCFFGLKTQSRLCRPSVAEHMLEVFVTRIIGHYIRDLSTSCIVQAKRSTKEMPTVPVANLAMRNLEDQTDNSR